MVVEVFADGDAVRIGVPFFEDFHQFFVRDKISFDNILVQETALVNVLENWE